MIKIQNPTYLLFAGWWANSTYYRFNPGELGSKWVG